MKTRFPRTTLAISTALVLAAGSAPAFADGAAARRATANTAQRAAAATGGRVVHDVDQGQTIVVRGGAATARAVTMTTGANAVLAGTGPLRLTGAREDAAIAALSQSQRDALQAALASANAAIAEGDDALSLGGATAHRTMMMATNSAAANSNAATAVASNSAAQAAMAPANPGDEHRPAFFDTSEFLAGRIAVNVVFVQSQQGGHDWSDDDKSDAESDLVQGLDMWAQEMPLANLSFSYRTFTTTTPDQPITESSQDRANWIEQSMEQLGVATHGPDAGWRQHYLNVYELDNQARAALGTDWAFTVFFVRAATSIGEIWDSATGNANGNFVFQDGMPAFTMRGGPYMVMPYSKVWGVHFWNAAILTHEFGHVFYALDEYPAFAAQGHDGSETAGYFNEVNGNIQGAGALTDDNCIMRGSFKAVMDYILDHILSIFTFGSTSSWDYSVCAFTQAQIGYVDHDGNGRLDTFDTPPTAGLSAYISRDAVVHATITTEVGATPNLNTYADTIHTPDQKRDLSLDTVTGIWWSVDGCNWISVPLAACAEAGQQTSVWWPMPNLQDTSASVTVYVATQAGLSAETTITANKVPVRRWWPIRYHL